MLLLLILLEQPGYQLTKQMTVDKFNATEASMPESFEKSISVPIFVYKI